MFWVQGVQVKEKQTMDRIELHPIFNHSIDYNDHFDGELAQ